MEEVKSLEKALQALHSNIIKFPIGAVSLQDFKPVDEKIKETRQVLQHVNATILRLKVLNEARSAEESLAKDTSDTLESAHDAITNALIHRQVLRLCLYSNAINDICAGRADEQIQTKLTRYVPKLFALNDSGVQLYDSIEEAFEKQLKLKMECHKAVINHHEFLQKQADIRKKKLQETHPEIARNKEKVMTTIEKINLMKRMITNIIGAASHMVTKDPKCRKMLSDHRSLITAEMIVEISQKT